MRDIKFRAWIKKEYDQCGGFMLCSPDNESTDYFMVSNGTGFAVVYDEDWLKDDAYEIMQFTGLHDKNGKGVQEVYEGDIIDETGNIRGNVHENRPREVDLVIPKLGTKAWRSAYKEALGRGFDYAE